MRTYNFPENRIADHRVGFKAYNLDQVLDGALDDLLMWAALATMLIGIVLVIFAFNLAAPISQLAEGITGH